MSPSTTNPSSFLKAASKQNFTTPPRILIIGAGSRGTSYASAALSCSNARVVAVCEPNDYKRVAFGRKFIWGDSVPNYGAAWKGWREWVKYENERQETLKTGEGMTKDGGFKPVIVDAVFVCVLDEMHEEVLCGIAGLGVSICCEKPLSTSLRSCLNIYRALTNKSGEKVDGDGKGHTNGVANRKETVFGICHVLRYSPHNMMLRHLVVDHKGIGDILSIEHVEPVGWWHFSHSYVRYVSGASVDEIMLTRSRGNWRKESKAAPSLLTKSCHDIDFLMWMLCTPPPDADQTPHLPSHVTSTGSRKFFRQARKPKEAGDATNCLSCDYEAECDYSAKKIYLDRHLATGNTDWPVKIVNPEIEDIYKTSGEESAAKQLLKDLSEDYTPDTPTAEVEARPWFGRCVWEADNDVCDDQCVTITWDDDPLSKDDKGRPELNSRGAKNAQFHMVAFTEKQCERRGRIYGSKGEIEYDSSTIRVHNFSTGRTEAHEPHQAGGGHGGGDEGLVRQFLMAVNAVDNEAMPAATAQREFLGCDLEEAFRSHAAVFAAEEARNQRKVVDWKTWWDEKVEGELHKQ